MLHLQKAFSTLLRMQKAKLCQVVLVFVPTADFILNQSWTNAVTLTVWSESSAFVAVWVMAVHQVLQVIMMLPQVGRCERNITL